MKKYLSKVIPAFIIISMFLFAPSGVITDLNADQNNDSGVGYLENILFEKLSGRERISLVVSQQPQVAPPSIQSDGNLLIRLDDLFAPEHMRNNVGEGRLLNVTSVSAQQQTEAGRQWVNLRIRLKENVPYTIRQDGKIIVIDFNISGVEAKLKKASSLVDRSQRSSLAQTEMERSDQRDGTKKYTGKNISLDFQDADIKSVLRLMSEYGDKSIIAGDDVKGNVTLNMKNVPWDQALESILKIHGLTKQQSGNVITVMTLERKKKDEKDKKDADAEQYKAEEERSARALKSDVEKGKLRQIMIEAKIVEVSEEFVRNMGVQWGFGNHSTVGNYGLGLSAGTNPLTQTNAQTLSYPAEIPFTQTGTTDMLEMAAVNFPSSVLGPTLGLVFGGARSFIEVQLSALEATTEGKIISSPKVVTMDNVKAVIKQGDDVPYVTPASGTSPATVTFKEAVLRLEVTPKITDDGRISMEIKATNDSPDYAQGEKLQGNPPIRKNEVESKIVVSDGDTVVIGGVSKIQDDKINSGVPWFLKIPIFGWLFKTENVKQQKRQLMIFITPKILAGSGQIEDACDMSLDNVDKCRNWQ
ncbi:MAG: secretin and TonB N-terminal domain-containing protein [Smithella sp.]|jgi:type IV pilus assembly protein PilQ